MRFGSIEELVGLAEANGASLAEIVWRFEVERSERTAGAVWNDMAASLAVMREAVKQGLANREKSFSGLVGGDARRLAERAGGRCLAGSPAVKAAAYAMAVSEINAAMGKVVACPTAGSCGIMPGAMLAAAESGGYDDDRLVRGLFTAAGIGIVIAENATVSGACGGCQAECGSAAAMAAGAIVEMAGGTPREAAQALALALKNLLGLVCDPVAGLVEVPCVKRNSFGAVHALLAADMALAGVESVIPPDEVIDAMRQIGRALPESLRETSAGGLAITPTGARIAEKLFAGNRP